MSLRVWLYIAFSAAFTWYGIYTGKIKLVDPDLWTGFLLVLAGVIAVIVGVAFLATLMANRFQRQTEREFIELLRKRYGKE